jgi:hypothetical protein
MPSEFNPKSLLFSFESIFVLFLYSSVFDRVFLSNNYIPNLTVVFAILTVFAGIWVQFNRGILTVDTDTFRGMLTVNTDILPVLLLFSIFIGYGTYPFFGVLVLTTPNIN